MYVGPCYPKQGFTFINITFLYKMKRDIHTTIHAIKNLKTITIVFVKFWMINLLFTEFIIFFIFENNKYIK